MTETEETSRDVIVVILGGGRGSRLDPLTRLRSKPAVPIAGKFRLIDIPISNAINSGMRRMFVLTQFNSVSLHRHIAWTYIFDRFSRGFCEILAAQQTPAEERWYSGTADAVRRNLSIIEESSGDHVLILSGDHMYRMDYRPMLEEHKASGADVTIAALPSSEAEIAEFGAIRIDGDGRIAEFREKPKDAAARAGMEAAPELLAKRKIAADRPYLASMGIYLFKKTALIDLLAGDDLDFGHHILPPAASSHHLHAYLHDGYWRDIGTIASFYRAHMDLVEWKPAFDFYDERWPFFTRARFLPPARITGCSFERSMLAEGTRLESCEIEQSVIGVRAVIRGATIRRSLVMGADDYLPEIRSAGPALGIGRGSVIEDAIIDKNARIGRDVKIVNEKKLQEAEGDGWVIRDGIVAVAKGAIIPDGTVI